MISKVRGWLVLLWTWIAEELGFQWLLTAAFASAPKPNFGGGTKWGDLPPELVEQILSNCSVVELARLATTCKTFQAAYRREVGREQKARHKLALEWFGRERIKCIAGLVDRWLKGEPLHPQMGRVDFTYCSISADGSLHLEGSGNEIFAKTSTRKARNILMLVVFDSDLPGSVWLDVVEPSFGDMGMQVSRGEEIWIYIEPAPEGDVRSVALVQALLTGDLPDTRADLPNARAIFPNPQSVSASPFSDTAQPILLEIYRKFPRSPAKTRAALRAVIGPLLPLTSRYCASMGRGWFGKPFDKEHVQPRAVESHANNGILLRGIITPTEPWFSVEMLPLIPLVFPIMMLLYCLYLRVTELWDML